MEACKVKVNKYYFFLQLAVVLWFIAWIFKDTYEGAYAYAWFWFVRVDIELAKYFWFELIFSWFLVGVWYVTCQKLKALQWLLVLSCGVLSCSCVLLKRHNCAGWSLCCGVNGLWGVVGLHRWLWLKSTGFAVEEKSIIDRSLIEKWVPFLINWIEQAVCVAFMNQGKGVYPKCLRKWHSKKFIFYSVRHSLIPGCECQLQGNNRKAFVFRGNHFELFSPFSLVFAGEVKVYDESIFHHFFWSSTHLFCVAKSFYIEFPRF